MPITSALLPINNADSAAARLVGTAPRKDANGARGAAQEFEAFVLQSFIEAMLPKKAGSVFGGGTAGEIWRSMLAEQVAKEVARSGGVGIAELIAPLQLNNSRVDR